MILKGLLNEFYKECLPYNFSIVWFFYACTIIQTSRGTSDSETAVEEDSSTHKNYQSYGQPPVEGVWENKIIFDGTETNFTM